MKKTIFELLGMIKDGKAPEKIKYQNIIYIYYERLNDMFNYKSDDKRHRFLEEDYYIENILNDEVEILDEPKKDKIEKLNQTLNIIDMDDDYYRYIMENRFKINEIIDKINKE